MTWILGGFFAAEILLAALMVWANFLEHRDIRQDLKAVAERESFLKDWGEDLDNFEKELYAYADELEAKTPKDSSP